MHWLWWWLPTLTPASVAKKHHPMKNSSVHTHALPCIDSGGGVFFKLISDFRHSRLRTINIINSLSQTDFPLPPSLVIILPLIFLRLSLPSHLGADHQKWQNLQQYSRVAIQAKKKKTNSCVQTYTLKHITYSVHNKLLTVQNGGWGTLPLNQMQMQTASASKRQYK